MKKQFLLCLLTLLGSACIFVFPGLCILQEKEKESPDEPYENFMLQRTYPNKTFDINAYRTALNGLSQDYSTAKLSSTLSWTMEGPGNIGGRFNCIAVDPGNSSVMYAGSANGGVWKTTDNGANWFPVTDALPYQAIGAIAINPTNTNEIWIGTGDVNISGTMYAGNGVYKSTDAGQTWNYLGLSDTYIVSSIAFNSSNTNQVLIGTMGNAFNKDANRGMYRTTDGGLSFTNTLFLNDSTGIIDMVQHPTNPSIVYCSSFSRQRTDNYSLINGTEVYLYKSTDFGLTWTQLSGGLPNGLSHERLGIAISKNNPLILYALYSNSSGLYPELYKTTDGGISWQVVSVAAFDTYAYGSNGWYFGKIFIDPGNPNTLYIPGVDLQYSTDGGNTWNLRTPQWWNYIVHGDGHYIYFNSSSDFIYCTDGGLYRTQDGGNNWTDMENIPNNQFYAVTENLNNVGEYAGGVQDNGTMYGNSGVFNNYTRIYGGDGFTVQYTSNPFLIYSESQYGNIVYDDAFNSGNWLGIQTDPGQYYNWHTPYFTSPHNENTLFFGGQQVMRIDGAPYGNYTIMSPVLHDPLSVQRVSNISTLNQSLLDSNILYAGTADGKVWNTLDYGNNWTDITPFTGISYYVTKVMPSPNVSSNAYVTRSGYRSNDNTPLIFKTTINGGAWTNISGNLPALAVNDIEILPGNENVIFIANDAGVYYTSDAGMNWTRLGNNMPYVAVLDIHLNYDNSILLAGTFGRSMYSIDIQSIGIKEYASAELIDLKLYPNPAADKLTVSASGQIRSVSVYSMQGKFISGALSPSLNVSELPAGTYIAEVFIENKKYRKQFIKS
ncbi:MAG: VPS10 domain-containing protein [Bacteroidia bacterium]